MSKQNRIQPLFQLDSKIALVTGASKGIGEAMARGLAEFGAKVLISSRKQEIEAIPQYKARVEQLLGSLNEGNYNLACEAASYPSLATGYEKLKNKHVEHAETFWNRKHTDFTSGNGKVRGKKIPSSSFLESSNPF